MNRQTLKKATVAALLSSFLVLAVPAMGAEQTEPSRLHTEATPDFFSLAWLSAQLDAVVGFFSMRTVEPNLTPNRKDAVESTKVHQRTCTNMDTNGCNG